LEDARTESILKNKNKDRKNNPKNILIFKLFLILSIRNILIL